MWIVTEICPILALGVAIDSLTRAFCLWSLAPHPGHFTFSDACFSMLVSFSMLTSLSGIL